MNPLRTRRKSSLKEIHPDKWANLRVSLAVVLLVPQLEHKLKVESGGSGRHLHCRWQAGY